MANERPIARHCSSAGAFCVPFVAARADAEHRDAPFTETALWINVQGLAGRKAKGFATWNWLAALPA